MSSTSRTPNQDEAISAIDSVTGFNVYPTATNRRLDTNSLVINGALNPVNIGADYTLYGALNVDSLLDQISVPFFTTAEMNTQTISLAANGGSEAVTNSNLVITTGTSTTGTAGRRSKARLLYDPGHEARSVFTTGYTATTAGCKQQHGLMSEDGSNGAYFENDGTDFFIVHKRGGTEVSKLSSAQWNGNIATQYTLNGTVVPFNDAERANGLVYMIKFGYLGYLGIEYWVYAPDGNAVLIHKIKYRDTTPLFYDLNLYMVQKATKTSGASSVQMISGSWEAGIFGAPVDPVISSINSTTTALLANATFNASPNWQAISENKSLGITIQTDQQSATNGIVISFSDRGDAGATVRTQRIETFNAQDVSTGFKKITIPTELSYVWVSYTNGGTNQGSLFLQTRMHATPVELPRTNIESTVNASNTALMTRGMMFAKSPIDNTYQNETRTQPDASSRIGHHVGIMNNDVEFQGKSLSTASYGALNTTTTATRVDNTPSLLTNRKIVRIANADNNTTIFYGYDNAVTTSTGFPLAPGVSHDIEADTNVAIYTITTAGTVSTRINQFAGTN